MDAAQQAASAAEGPVVSHPLRILRYPLPIPWKLHRLRVLRDFLALAECTLRQIQAFAHPGDAGCLIPVGQQLERLTPAIATIYLMNAGAAWIAVPWSGRANECLNWRPTMRALDHGTAATVLAALVSHAASLPKFPGNALTAAALRTLPSAMECWAKETLDSGAAASQHTCYAALIALRRALIELEADLLPWWDDETFYKEPQTPRRC
jgi:hypothetical protein